MKQKELPGFDLDGIETSSREKRHIFMFVMSDIGHLMILSTQRKNSTAWNRLAKNRVHHPTIFDQVIETMESF